MAHDGKVEHPSDEAAAHRAERGRGSVQRPSGRAVGSTDDDRNTTVTGLSQCQIQWHLAKQRNAELLRKLRTATGAEQ